ncbi:DUF4431 domain-containing protein [Lelliottia sp. V89_10]|uniref:DUF4431 domain-containing protein n=1 Tax=Lelliottia wanjuensis TaxID=3050585 RepID=UPI00249F2B29|nr:MULTISPECIES: DUF4431 domain-containing protein [unclassified Lelliottia]MDI3361621.1 DUF4431 domain-containing protein [Lelliottia sp. V89_13]MDK9550102.1 DUF4431 domain-containing protein [Lelliottia sp. V89_5]MDK9595313.1 DUF4431 domain-containing protein [Lelliottia sp. V89_10]
MRSLLLVLGLFVIVSAHSTCLNVADITTLTGKLVMKTYSGPDDDTKQYKRFVLELDRPFDCVVDVDDSFLEWNKDVTVLLTAEAMNDKVQQYMNKHVVVSGEAILAESGYHFTAIVMLLGGINNYAEDVKK